MGYLGFQIRCTLKIYTLLLLFLVVVVARNPRDLLKLSSSSSGVSIDSIYQFGDSVSDTGNLIREDPSRSCSTFPYGESFFHYATGRCSDGLLTADYYAIGFGLPFLNPYLEQGANFTQGVNFAVGGTTALDVSFLESMDITFSGSNSSLSVQLGWFRNHLNSICSSTTECKEKLQRSLVLMEAVGGNDYASVLEAGLPFQDYAFDLVPYVVEAITDAVKEMVGMGAIHVVVPGAFPYGCMPSYLVTASTSTKPDMYDELGCLTHYNALAEFHNHQLRTAIQHLQTQHPNATLIFADYYAALQTLLRNAASLGFEEDKILTACCGNGHNPYNFNKTDFCGTLGVPVCPTPKTRVMWDGYHFTQEAYSYLCDSMLNNTIFPRLATAFSL